MKIPRIAPLLLLGLPIFAAEFENGQAARAVIGQPSFSAHDAGLNPVALTLGNGKLYAADASRRVLGFDLGQLPGVRDEVAERVNVACRVCVTSPSSSVAQSVLANSASFSLFGRVAVQADAQNHRVLIWRDVSAPRAFRAPDVILGRGNGETVVSDASIGEPISVAYDGKRLFVGDAAWHRVLVWNSLPAFDNQPADAVLGQANFTSASLSEAPGADTIGRPSALVSDGTNLYIADAAEHRILVFSAGDLALASGALLNSASLAAGPVAPGTLVNIQGTALSEKDVQAPDEESRLPKKLGGVEVYLNGAALPLLAVSESQIRAQLPYNLGPASSGSLTVRTERSDGTVAVSNAIAVKIAAATPGIFAFGGKEPRGAMALRGGHASGDSGTPLTSDNPARPGEILTVWAAGLGAVTSEDSPAIGLAGEPFEGADAVVVHAVTARVGGEPAEVLSATLPHGSIGVYEVRIQLASDTVFDASMPMQISQDGINSNTVTFPARTAVH